MFRVLMNPVLDFYFGQHLYTFTPECPENLHRCTHTNIYSQTMAFVEQNLPLSHPGFSPSIWNDPASVMKLCICAAIYPLIKKYEIFNNVLLGK